MKKNELIEEMETRISKMEQREWLTLGMVFCLWALIMLVNFKG